MEIKILGHRNCAAFLSKEAKQWDVLYISSPNDKYAIEGSEKIAELAREYSELFFYDVCFSFGSMSPPTLEDVQRGLDFGKDKEKLIVSCQAGVSRSSALAYLIYASKVGAEQALNLLEMDVHEPNNVIIQHGEEILGFPVVELVSNWKNLALAQELDKFS